MNEKYTAEELKKFALRKSPRATNRRAALLLSVSGYVALCLLGEKNQLPLQRQLKKAAAGGLFFASRMRQILAAGPALKPYSHFLAYSIANEILDEKQLLESLARMSGLAIEEEEKKASVAFWLQQFYQKRSDLKPSGEVLRFAREQFSELVGSGKLDESDDGKVAAFLNVLLSEKNQPLLEAIRKSKRLRSSLSDEFVMNRLVELFSEAELRPELLKLFTESLDDENFAAALLDRDFLFFLSGDEQLGLAEKKAFVDRLARSEGYRRLKQRSPRVRQAGEELRAAAKWMKAL